MYVHVHILTTCMSDLYYLYSLIDVDFVYCECVGEVGVSAANLSTALSMVPVAISVRFCMTSHHC